MCIRNKVVKFKNCKNFVSLPPCLFVYSPFAYLSEYVQELTYCLSVAKEAWKRWGLKIESVEWYLIAVNTNVWSTLSMHNMFLLGCLGTCPQENSPSRLYLRVHIFISIMVAFACINNY